MGLPLFITPVEPEVAAKSAEKTASGSRSSIRRQRTFRGNARPTGEFRRRRHGMLRDNLDDLQEVMDSETGRLPPTPGQNSESLGPHGRQPFHDSERMRLRDTISFERQNHLIDEIDGPFMPPVPESRDYSGTRDRQRELMRSRAVRNDQRRQDLRRMARRRPAPIPPYAEAELNHMARDGLIIESPGLSSTPDRSSSNQSPTNQSWSPLRPSDGLDHAFMRGLSHGDREARSELSARVQALNNRASNSLEQSRLDGLGDRDRSLSPENGAAWDTLLTSITPDPQPPSVGSSFASAAAAASSGSGGTSTSTSMTSVNGPGDSPILRDCDNSDSDSNTDEEEDDIYELQGTSRTRPHDLWTYAEVATTRANRAARSGDSEQLEGMHQIISGLASREEIPDEWWASAGLSRNLRREPAM